MTEFTSYEYYPEAVPILKLFYFYFLTYYANYFWGHNHGKIYITI